MHWENQNRQTSFFLREMEKRIPKDDLYRIIDEKIDFSFVNELANPGYSRLGPIGYSPERLFRMLVVMYLENIPSERKLVEQLNVNIRYMWFTKTDLDSPVPDHSTFSVFRSRLGDALFKEIFARIVGRLVELGIAQPRSISVDSTSVLADVKLPREEDKGARVKGKQVISTNDPDARYGRVSKIKRFFGYKAQMVVDNDSRCILNVDAEPGNAEDYDLKEEFIKEAIQYGKHTPKEAALDKGFDANRIRRFFKEQKIQAAIPARADHTANTNFYQQECFQIDVQNKQVTCPAKKQLRYAGFKRKTSAHIFTGTACSDCQLKQNCTPAKFRTIQIHQDYAIREEAIRFNNTRHYRKILKKRGCIERIFAEAKRFHGMLRAKFRNLWKLKIQCYLTAIVINLKRTAKFFIEHPQLRTITLKTGP